MCPAVPMISHARSDMSAQGIFGSPPNRRRFWRRPVLAKLGLSDEAARSTAAKAAQEPRQGSDQGIDVRYTIRVDRVALARRATGTIRDLQGPLARNQTVLDVVTFV